MTDIDLTHEVQQDDLLGAKRELAALTGTTLTDIDGAVMELTGGERDAGSQARAIAELAALTSGAPAELLPDGFMAWPESEGSLPLALTGGDGPDSWAEDGDGEPLTAGQYAALTVAQGAED